MQRRASLAELIAARGLAPSTVAYAVHRRLLGGGDQVMRDFVEAALEQLLSGAPLGWSFFFGEGTEQRGAVLAEVIDMPVAEVKELALVAGPTVVVEVTEIEETRAVGPRGNPMPSPSQSPNQSPMPSQSQSPMPSQSPNQSPMPSPSPNQSPSPSQSQSQSQMPSTTPTPSPSPSPKYGTYGKRTTVVPREVRSTGVVTGLDDAPAPQTPVVAPPEDREKLFDLLTKDRGGGHWAATSAATAKQLSLQLGAYLQRDLALTAPWGLPFLLERAGRGLLFERAPRAPGLTLDVLADGGPIGAVRIRAAAQSGEQRPFSPVRCEDERALVVDGGDVLLAVQSTGWPLRPQGSTGAK